MTSLVIESAEQNSVAFAGLRRNQCAVSAEKKAAKKTAKSPEITIDFSEPAKEWSHFNHFWVEKKGEFICINLGFLDDSGHVTVIFKGMQWQADLENQRQDLENYITRIGAPNPDQVLAKHPSYTLTRIPIPINSLGCASRKNWGEISILQFSHKDVVGLIKRAEAGSFVKGATYGCYISDIDTHKKLIYEVLTATDKQ